MIIGIHIKKSLLLKTVMLISMLIFTIFFVIACSKSGGKDDSESSENRENPENTENSQKPETEESGSPENKKVHAYIVKIGGKEIAYLSKKEEIDELKKAFCNAKEKELQGTEIVEISIKSEIEYTETLCLPEEIQNINEVVSKFNESGGKISFSVVLSEKETKYLSFETVYQKSSAYYEGTKVTKSKGIQGEKELKYNVTYVDGKEEKRELVSEKTVKSPKKEVILVGTKKKTASTGKYDWPLKIGLYITSKYGGRYINGRYDFHLGVDLRAPSGTYVYAADGGKVVHVGTFSSYGKLIKIQHDNGDFTYYAHLGSYKVKEGQRVYKGQIIALSGATGNVTGPHLHFEIRKNGRTVNPVSYLPKVRMERYNIPINMNNYSYLSDKSGFYRKSA